MIKNKLQIEKEIERKKVFINLAKEISKLSNCISNQMGAVLIRDKMIISTGYNGTPKKILDCNNGGCERCNDKKIKSGEQLNKCICVHAEQNAVIQAAYNGISTKDSEMYSTNKPCNECLKLLINAGVKKVFYIYPYNTKTNINLLKNIELNNFNEYKF